MGHSSGLQPASVRVKAGMVRAVVHSGFRSAVVPEDLVYLPVHEHDATRRGIADGDADRRLLEHRLDLAPLGVLLGGEPLGRLPDAHVLRHLDAHDRHTLDGLGRIAQRLQHEGEDALGRGIRPVEPHVILVGVLRLPRENDPVEQLGEAVAGDSGSASRMGRPMSGRLPTISMNRGLAVSKRCAAPRSTAYATGACSNTCRSLRSARARVSAASVARVSITTEVTSWMW